MFCLIPRNSLFWTTPLELSKKVWRSAVCVAVCCSGLGEWSGPKKRISRYKTNMFFGQLHGDLQIAQTLISRINCGSLRIDYFGRFLRCTQIHTLCSWCGRMFMCTHTLTSDVHTHTHTHPHTHMHTHTHTHTQAHTHIHIHIHIHI